MKRRIVVIGAGIAGLAAAWSATREGHDVTLVSRGAGASALGGGAVDAVPWEQLMRAARTLGAELRAGKLAAEVVAFARALAIWDLPEESAPLPLLATWAGRVRPSRGRDRALLDLAPLAGKLVLLPRAERPGWDADALAAGLADDPLARERNIAFAAVDLPVLRFDEERRIADGDLAARCDDVRRLHWLATRLRERLAAASASAGSDAAGAVLLGPWLGANEARAEMISTKVGVPVGEILVGVGSPAGQRFEAARDRMLRELAVRVVRGRVSSVEVDGARVLVSLEDEATPIAADAVVLAVGGVAGGGVVYAPPESDAGADVPPAGKVPFALSLRAPVTIAAQTATVPWLRGTQALGVVGSLHGPELDLTAWPSDGRLGALESAGVLCDGVRAGIGIVAAGDVVAGRARTVLEAVGFGVRAGREA